MDPKKPVRHRKKSKESVMILIVPQQEKGAENNDLLIPIGTRRTEIVSWVIRTKEEESLARTSKKTNLTIHQNDQNEQERKGRGGCDGAWKW